MFKNDNDLIGLNLNINWFFFFSFPIIVFCFPDSNSKPATVISDNRLTEFWKSRFRFNFCFTVVVYVTFVYSFIILLFYSILFYSVLFCFPKITKELKSEKGNIYQPILILRLMLFQIVLSNVNVLVSMFVSIIWVVLYLFNFSSRILSYHYLMKFSLTANNKESKK